MLFAPPIGRIFVLLAGIHGTVRSAGETRPVVGVHVELDGVESAVTDSAGRYALTQLAAGPHLVRFLAAGYENRQLTVLLADSSELALDVEVTPRPVLLAPITVVARVPFAPPRTLGGFGDGWQDAGHYHFGPGWQGDLPAGSIDVLGALARVPGVTTRGDNATALSVHGARGSETLTLLDGIPVFGAVHFAGAASAINPDAIATIDLHSGVAPARFGGALSGVVELETGEALGGHQITGGLSTADVRSTFQTTLGPGGGVLLGARSSIRNLMTDATGLGATNGYQDFLAIGSGVIGTGTLRLVGFESSNRIRWEAAVSGGAGNFPPATPATSDGATWQSSVLGATWSQSLGHGRGWHAAGWWSGTAATVTTLATNRTDRLTSSLGEIGLSMDWIQRSPTSTLSFGGELTRPQSAYQTSAAFETSGTAHVGVALAGAPLLGGVFGEWDWQGPSRMDFRLGLRANTDFRESISLDPRIAVSVHLDQETRLEVGYGRTHQYLQSMLNEDNLMSALIGPPLLTPAPSGEPASADQWVVSLARRLAPGVTVGIDGYHRSWHHQLAPAVTTSGFFVATSPTYTDGEARGLHASLLIVRGQLSAQASAGLAGSVERANGLAYPSSFDRPWSVSGDVTYHLGTRTAVQVQWNAGAGQPATALQPGITWLTYQPATGIGEIEGAPANLAGAINALRLNPPLRVDLGVRREWHLGSSARSGGVMTAIRLENLFNRTNPLGILAQPDGALQLLPGASRGIVFEVGWAH